MPSIVLATEDALSEAVALRLVSEAGLIVSQCLRRDGSGYLRQRVQSFLEMARRGPVVVFADLDRSRCPATLIADWLGPRPMHPKLLIRIAVREIESWVLADSEAIARLLRQAVRVVPRAPDELADPKRTLLRLAARAPRRIRDDLVAARGAIASQGLNYNSVISSFVATDWDPVRAAVRSPSLCRARTRLSELAGDV